MKSDECYFELFLTDVGVSYPLILFVEGKMYSSTSKFDLKKDAVESFHFLSYSSDFHSLFCYHRKTSSSSLLFYLLTKLAFKINFGQVFIRHEFKVDTRYQHIV